MVKEDQELYYKLHMNPEIKSWNKYSASVKKKKDFQHLKGKKFV